MDSKDIECHVLLGLFHLQCPNIYRWNGSFSCNRPIIRCHYGMTRNERWLVVGALFKCVRAVDRGLFSRWTVRKLCGKKWDVLFRVRVIAADEEWAFPGFWFFYSHCQALHSLMVAIGCSVYVCVTFACSSALVFAILPLLWCMWREVIGKGIIFGDWHAVETAPGCMPWQFCKAPLPKLYFPAMTVSRDVLVVPELF